MNNSQRKKDFIEIISNKKNIKIRNAISLKNNQYSLTNTNNDIFYNKKGVISNRNNILSEKLISTNDIKKKHYLERNANNLNVVCFTTSSTNNIKINPKLKNSNIHLIIKKYFR